MTRSPRRERRVRAGLRRGDDTGSLAMALMMTIVALGLSALLVPMVVTQVSSTRHAVQRVDALNAAQSGIDVAIGQIRAATDLSGNGKRDMLPCGTLQGSLDTTNTEQWSVKIDYLLVNPQKGLDDVQLDNWLRDNRIPCNPSAGVMSTPGYALLRADGVVPSVGAIPGSTRSLRATYTFQTTNANIPGGLIHVVQRPGDHDLCLDAGPANANTPLLVQQCDHSNAQQQFAYTPNLTLVLVASKTAARPAGMCLDAATPHNPGDTVWIRPCTTPVPTAQRWSLDDVANFEGTAASGAPDNTCFNVQRTNTFGSAVVLGKWYADNDPRNTCKSMRSDRWDIETFMPEASVGAGAAGPGDPPKPPPYQLVNFYEFGRCMDVANGDPTSAYMIVWPCKQAPDPSMVGWNQMWTPPTILAGATSATGRITVLYKGATPNVLYCLVSPMSTATNMYVKLTACPPSGTPPNMTWTITGNTGSYATSYRIMDGSGNSYCLAPTDPNATPPDFFIDGGTTSAARISKAVVVTCSGSTLQKWNAPPNVVQTGPLKDITER